MIYLRKASLIVFLTFFLFFIKKSVVCQVDFIKFNNSVDLDNEFNDGSKIDVFLITAQKKNDLFILCKIWGFIKYYHSSVAKGKYNWDYELFRILPKIIDCKDINERNKILLEWINNLGELDIGNQIVVDSSLVKLYPNIGWIKESQILGKELSNKLLAIYYAKRSNINYYVSISSKVGNPDFINEKPYNQFPFPDLGFRILSLYRYWNIIEYFYPYKYLIDKNWDSVFYQFVPKFVYASNILEYKLSCLSLISNINDSHADIYGDFDIEKFKGIYVPPYRVSFVENKLVVVKSLSNRDVLDTALQKGDIILKINSISVEDIVKEKMSYISGSNYSSQMRKIASDILRTNTSSIAITFQRNGIENNICLRTNLTKKDVDIYFKNEQPDSCYKIINSKIGYIYLGNIMNKYIDSIMLLFKETDGIIIDLRNYPKESVMYKLGSYLYPSKLPFAISSNTSTEMPGLFKFKESPNYIGGGAKDSLYKKNIILLVNEYTQSHGEYMAMALQQYENTKIIGSTTSGADGNISKFYLPGGLNTIITGIGIYYPNGQETQRVGIIPDIYTNATIKGISEGRDELLEKAIEFINKKRK